VNAVGDTYVAVIRGTAGAEEWIDNCVFIAYRPLASGLTVPLADGIKVAVGGADVLVLGHSLGSALAECLTYQLADANSLGAAHVGAIMYASPKLGDHDFVDAFDSQVTNYTVINFEHDVVPRVPPFDITHFDLYRPLPFVYAITDETALASVNPLDKRCCHHLIDYIAMLSPAVFTQSIPAWTPDEKQCAKCLLAPANLVELAAQVLAAQAAVMPP
jgi:triacylglycerol lipase